MGKIIFDDEPDNIPEAQYSGINYVDKVSCKEIIRYNEGPPMPALPLCRLRA